MHGWDSPPKLDLRSLYLRARLDFNIYRQAGDCFIDTKEKVKAIAWSAGGSLSREFGGSEAKRFEPKGQSWRCGVKGASRYIDQCYSVPSPDSIASFKEGFLGGRRPIESFSSWFADKVLSRVVCSPLRSQHRSEELIHLHRLVSEPDLCVEHSELRCANCCYQSKRYFELYRSPNFCAIISYLSTQNLLLH